MNEDRLVLVSHVLKSTTMLPTLENNHISFLLINKNTKLVVQNTTNLVNNFLERNLLHLKPKYLQHKSLKFNVIFSKIQINVLTLFLL